MRKTENLTLLGVMTAVILVMFVVPGLGFIPVGIFKATIIHIPVIIMAIVKGPKLGAILGGVFGITSIIDKIIRPVLTSPIFINPLVSLLPRILIGLVVGFVAIALRKKESKYNLDLILSAGLGSLINTVGVLGMIYILYGQEFLERTGQVGKSVIGVLGYTALTNGLIEMVLSIIIAVPISKILIKMQARGKK